MAETSLKNNLKRGEIKILRPSKLAAEGVTGTVAEGVYEGSKPNKFNAAKSDYFIRAADDTLIIINETQSLKDQLGQLDATAGTKVKVVYEGKLVTKAGNSFHNFECFIVD